VTTEKRDDFKWQKAMMQVTRTLKVPRKWLDLWKLFKKNGQKALCKVCKSKYTYHEETVNLRDHLIRVHPWKLRLLADQPCLNAYLPKTKCAEGRAKKKTEHIANMVGCNLRPTAMIEGINSYEVLWASISSAICDTYCWRKSFYHQKNAIKIIYKGRILCLYNRKLDQSG